MTTIALPTPFDLPHISDRQVIKRSDSFQNIAEVIKVKTDIPQFEDESFYMVDLRTVEQKYNQWASALPRVKPHYAIKANPDPKIIKVLADLGTGFDCASENEIDQVLKLGIEPSTVIFANPCKPNRAIEFAKQNKIPRMTFDNDHELLKISQHYAEAELVLRIMVDDSQSVNPLSSKFGAPMHTIPRLLRFAKELNLRVIGTSFHVGSDCKSVASYESALNNSYQVFQMAKEVGFDFHLLDIGGGWPGIDSNDATKVSFSEIAKTIAPLIDALFLPTISVIAEPGRFFCQASSTLILRVFAKRDLVDPSTNLTHFSYYLPEGIYQSFNCMINDNIDSYPAPYLIRKLTTAQKEILYPSNFYGPSSNPKDIISKNIMFPEINIGDWVFYRDMGAYKGCIGTPFEGFPDCGASYYIY